MNLDEFAYNFAWIMIALDQEAFDKEKARYAIYAVMALNKKVFDEYGCTVNEVLDLIQEKIWKFRGEI